MAIIISKKKKKQKYLILIFLAVAIVTAAILWFGFFKKEKSVVNPFVSVPLKEIKIDFEFLESETLARLQDFRKIIPFEPEKVGRENPFLSY